MRLTTSRLVVPILSATLMSAGTVAAGAGPASAQPEQHPNAAAQAHAQPAESKTPGRLPPGRSWKVTLLTGDVVRVTTVKDKPPLVSAKPGRGRTSSMIRKSIQPDGRIIVTPVDVARLVGGVLDPALFDVTGLIKQGYDDAHSTEVPLIVQGARGARTPAKLARTLRGVQPLTSIGAYAAKQPKQRANRLAKVLTELKRERSGVQHIWLDRRVRATATTAGLDRNLRQIGAPKAWRAGLTGRGVKVGVLDTGIDAGHPDLKDRIAASKNFSASKDVVDRYGHGTHVAATAAGTGAGAGGERKGVASKARLVIGKVLDDEGGGEFSDVIAGMEWAAPHARIVNMSLGSDEPSDGTDPLSKAIGTLTEKHGTLFVVAAGNDGPAGEITTPAAADAALTVGAVDARDKLAEFSTRGPRSGRYAAKPEIVAPGVDIVAARAKGTAMGQVVDSRYTSASGTSMATPHVAGAAALLAQQNPNWKADRLKAALAGSTGAVAGADAYQRGSGRLDAGAAATDATVSQQGLPHAGTAPYPQRDPLTTDLSWAGRRGNRLNLSVRVTDRQGRPTAGAAELSTRQVTVPASGSASAKLRIDPVRLASRPGFYIAEVAAQGGGATIRTPVTFFVEPRSHTLTVKATPLPGTPAGRAWAGAWVVNMADIAVFARGVDVKMDGTTTIRVPQGRYAVLGDVNDDTEKAPRSTLAGTPEVSVDRDTTVTLDGAAAKPVSATVQGTKTKMVMASADFVRSTSVGLWSHFVYTTEPDREKVYVQPTKSARTGTFRTYSEFRLTAPGVAYDLFHPMGDRFPADPSYVVTPVEKAKLARVDQRFAAFGGDTSKPLGENRYGISPEGMLSFESSWREVPAASTRTDYLSTGRGIFWLDEAAPRAIDGGEWVDQEPFRELKPGSRTTATWGRQPLRPGPYASTAFSPSICAPRPTTRTRGNLHVELVDLQARTDGFDCGLNEDTLKRKLELYAGGRKLGERAASSADFKIPRKAATYRLRYANDASKLLPVSTRTTTTWTFRSAAPGGLGAKPVPLLTVDYDLGLDLRNQPAGKPAVFSVARVGGSAPSPVTGLRLWTSADDGKTWQPVKVKALGDGRYSAPLPAPAKDKAVSLRVIARDAGGSAIRQQIMRASLMR